MRDGNCFERDSWEYILCDTIQLIKSYLSVNCDSLLLAYRVVMLSLHCTVSKGPLKILFPSVMQESALNHFFRECSLVMLEISCHYLKLRKWRVGTEGFTLMSFI